MHVKRDTFPLRSTSNIKKEWLKLKQLNNHDQNMNEISMNYAIPKQIIMISKQIIVSEGNEQTSNDDH